MDLTDPTTFARKMVVGHVSLLRERKANNEIREGRIAKLETAAYISIAVAAVEMVMAIIAL